MSPRPTPPHVIFPLLIFQLQILETYKAPTDELSGSHGGEYENDILLESGIEQSR
jgi:hypothetical protein